MKHPRFRISAFLIIWSGFRDLNQKGQASAKEDGSSGENDGEFNRFLLNSFPSHSVRH